MCLVYVAGVGNSGDVAGFRSSGKRRCLYGRCWDLRPTAMQRIHHGWVVLQFLGTQFCCWEMNHNCCCCCRRRLDPAGRQARRFLPGPPSILPSLAAVRRSGERGGGAEASGGAARGAADPAQPGDVMMTAFFQSQRLPVRDSTTVAVGGDVSKVFAVSGRFFFFPSWLRLFDFEAQLDCGDNMPYACVMFAIVVQSCRKLLHSISKHVSTAVGNHVRCCLPVRPG